MGTHPSRQKPKINIMLLAYLFNLNISDLAQWLEKSIFLEILKKQIDYQVKKLTIRFFMEVFFNYIVDNINA